MSRKTAESGQRGFTLLELMLVMLIMGLTLGLGMTFLAGSDRSLDERAQEILHAVSLARTDAILSRSRVVLRLDNGSLILGTGSGERPALTLDSGTSLVLCDENRHTSPRGELLFGPTGVSGEYLLLLSGAGRELSLYIPPTGSSLVRHGVHDLQDMRLELISAGE